MVLVRTYIKWKYNYEKQLESVFHEIHATKYL